jgi:hypothetical protein
VKKNKGGLALLIVGAVLLTAAALVICAMVFAPSPVCESVTLEAGSREIPLAQFPKEGKEVGLVTDISGIDLNQPGDHTLQFAYKEKYYDSCLKIVDTTPPVGEPVAHTIYNDETLTPDAFVTDIRDVTQTTVTFGKTPDFTAVGDQKVSLLLTDTSGNVGTVEAVLTVIADTTFPQFSPMEDLKVNIGQAVSYRKNVTATDDRDGHVSYTVDSSGVNLEKEGTYLIRYEATDASGNTTAVERNLIVSASLVINQELVEETADVLLAKILEEDMSAHDKIYTIFYYTRKNVSYTPSSEKDYWAAAYNAMTKQKGDCFNYFAMAKVLLDRCGIDNLPVERYKAKSSHYWLLVNIGTGWYHYDPSPQGLENPFRCFMKTNAEVKAYAKSRNDGRSDYYQFDESKYPELATEKYKEP